MNKTSNHGNIVNVNFDSYDTTSNQKRGRHRSKSMGASASTPSKTTALYASNKQQQPQDANHVIVNANVNVTATRISKKGGKFRLPKIERRRSRSDRRGIGTVGAGYGHGQGGEHDVSYNVRSGYGVVM